MNGKPIQQQNQVLSIIQFNCGRANYSLARTFFDALDPKRHQVIALQDPGKHKDTKATYTPRGYYLAMDFSESSKTAFLISREINQSDWGWQNQGNDASVLCLKIQQTWTRIINTYIPEKQYHPDGHERAFVDLGRILGWSEVPTLLLGDFNTHHPSWGGEDTRTDPTGETLCELQQINGLQLLTPPGTVTFQKGYARSTIDLAFASTFFSERLIRCTARDSWVSTRDHLPVELHFLARIARAEPRRGWNHKKIRKNLLLQNLTQDWQTHGLLPTNFQLEYDSQCGSQRDSQCGSQCGSSQRGRCDSQCGSSQYSSRCDSRCGSSQRGSQYGNNQCGSQCGSTTHAAEPTLRLPEGFDYHSDKLLTTEEIDQRITHIAQSIQDALHSYCQRTKPSDYSRRDWSPRCTQLIRERRRKMREAAREDNPQKYQAVQREIKRLRNQIKAELRRNAAYQWRLFLENVTTTKEGRETVWRIAKWARDKAGRAQGPPQLPPLRRDTQSHPTDVFQEKASILTSKFFPPPAQADLSDLQTPRREEYQARHAIPTDISWQELGETIKKLPSKKAPGPDELTNEILKAIRLPLAIALQEIFQSCLTQGYFPQYFRQTKTAVLRKEGKEDYSLPDSYRPIALENTLGKILEKVVAGRLADTLEKASLLPATQYGARCGKSVNTALTHLTTLIHTVWKADPNWVVSMLSLDLSGAFDKVSHERLLEILLQKGLPYWIHDFTRGFLTDRRTTLLLDGQESEWIRTAVGIPQGSPLSPILFLIFASPLLDKINTIPGPTLGLGFVDDTNLITWGPTTHGNCIRLQRIHQICEEWARKSGALFAPKKYSLIHYTRRRKRTTNSEIQITGFHGKPSEYVRVLGVITDRKLRWKQHIKQAAQKGALRLQALRRIAGSTWGLSFEKSRLLYQTTLRSAILHGCTVWAPGEESHLPPTTRIHPLRAIQNKALRWITGAFRRTPIPALEREANIPPLRLYLAAQAATIARTIDISSSGQQIRAHCSRVSQQVRNRANPTTPWTTLLSWWESVGERWLQDQWDYIFEKTSQGKTTPIWTLPPRTTGETLRKGLSRAESSILTQLRSECIGLNWYLHHWGVPGITTQCSCGSEAQTITHILTHCSNHQRTRQQILAATGSQDWGQIRQTRKGLQAAAKWLFSINILPQFSYAHSLLGETLEGWAPLTLEA
jgi:hypothetical protein